MPHESAQNKECSDFWITKRNKKKMKVPEEEQQVELRRQFLHRPGGAKIGVWTKKIGEKLEKNGRGVLFLEWRE